MDVGNIFIFLNIWIINLKTKQMLLNKYNLIFQPWNLIKSVCFCFIIF